MLSRSSHEPSPPPPGLPTIDFGYDTLREKMASFYLHFDSFVERTQRKVLEGKNDYERQLAENQESQKHIQQDIANLKTKNKEAVVAREKEEREEKDAEGLVREMRMKERAKASYLAALEESIAELKSQVEKKVAKREEKRRWLEKQASKNGPELQFWENILGMRIEGVEMGCLRIVFTNIHAKRWEREYEFVFRLDQKEYEGE